MPDAFNTPGQEANRSAPSPPAGVGRWRREFPGHQRDLAEMRRWLSSLLPECPARDQVLSHATEPRSTALEHTPSEKHGGWFAAALTRPPQALLAAVSEC